MANIEVPTATRIVVAKRIVRDSAVPIITQGQIFPPVRLPGQQG